MKTNYRNRAAALLALLLCAVLLLCACGEQAPAEEGVGANEANYKVTVTDAMGTPCGSGVIVRFMSNGQQAAMQVVDENGVASKVMAKGDYAVELVFTDSEAAFLYDQTDLTLTAEKTELTIMLSQAVGEAVKLNAHGEDVTAYRVLAGATSVKLDSGKRNYFLFAPTEAGTYEFSASGDVESIGYYGAPHFVQEHSAAEIVDGKFTISVAAGMIGTGDTGTTVLVLGIDAASAESCVLNIQRIGEAERTVSDEPWMVYQTTAKLTPYVLPAGASVREFDLTASSDAYKLVFNESDGFYHLDSAEGPLVLVRLGEDGQYLDSFKTILDHSGVNKYFYDEDGNFLKKESYSECLMEYFEFMDEENGVYPLTEDLKYIIQQRGDYSGWWDPDSGIYLFRDEAGHNIPDINHEIAWLFMCCYIAKG